MNNRLFVLLSIARAALHTDSHTPPRITILTWATNEYRTLYADFIAQNRRYADAHGYRYVLDETPPSSPLGQGTVTRHWGKVAALLHRLSAKTQVLAISHRPEFQRLADHTLKLAKRGEHTVVVAS